MTPGTPLRHAPVRYSTRVVRWLIESSWSCDPGFARYMIVTTT